MERAAIFLDRDGTINENVFNTVSGKWEAPLTAIQLRLLPGVVDALQTLQTAGYALILVSNQPNYALGKASLESMTAIHEVVVEQLAAAGVTLTDTYYCYHHPQGHVAGLSGSCACRKPSPYHLERARTRHALDMTRSWMVGDRGSDVACGKAAGVRTVFLTTAGHIPPRPDEPQPDAVAPGLWEAARLILDRAAGDPPENAARHPTVS